ncbi:hypothetical protein B0H16DRAFT_1545908 [Mycena metata]|uniref:Uncharacterized protein n=1 Tax=Mycena metata TaxID=1033252 RepID=A0AAD7IZK4_9AGAR|nr:hypothetical protein B0H16DRAFT_1545908 [Mycena metata]
MFTAILLPIAFSVPMAVAQINVFDPLVFLRVDAPLMGGFVDFNKFDTRSDADSDWIPLNTTGNPPGDLYLPFYNFNAQPFGPATTKAGYRLAGDETSEVVFIFNDNYVSPAMNVTPGRIHSDVETTIDTEAQLTYLPADTVVARDIWTDGTFIDLPFTSQTVFIGKDVTTGAGACGKPWNFTATVVTADGTTTVVSAINNLFVPVPLNTNSSITLQNSFDPGFLAVLTFDEATPWLFNQGSSPRIGTIALTVDASIIFCVGG